MPSVPKFRSVDWTHDMIIVKWQLLIWTKRKLCALTNRPPAQSTGTGQWLSRLFHVNCSFAQAFALHFWQFIFPLSCRRRPVLQVFRLSAKKDILKNFLFVMMTNVMVKACLNQKIIKISNLIQVKENSAMSEIVTYAKAEFFRKPNSSEYRMYRSVDWTHDMIIVRWQLLIWHKRKLCALTNRPPAQSTGTDQWLSRLFHANCSAAQVYVLNPWQYIFAQSCWRRSVLHVFLSFYQ